MILCIRSQYLSTASVAQSVALWSLATEVPGTIPASNLFDRLQCFWALYWFLTSFRHICSHTYLSTTVFGDFQVFCSPSIELGIYSDSRQGYAHCRVHRSQWYSFGLTHSDSIPFTHLKNGINISLYVFWPIPSRWSWITHPCVKSIH